MTWISVLLLFHHFCLLYPNQKGFTALLDAQVFQVARMPVKWSNLFRTWTLVGHQNLLSMPFCPFEKCWTKTLFCSTKLIYIYIHAIGKSPINSKSFSEMSHTSLQYLEGESLPVSTLNIRPCPKHPTPCRTRSRGAFGCRIWPQSWLSRLKRGFLCRPQCGRAPPSGGKLWGQGVKHMPVGYQGYTSGWNGWALKGLNSTSEEN